jgi:hypothetical protein
MFHALSHSGYEMLPRSTGFNCISDFRLQENAVCLLHTCADFVPQLWLLIVCTSVMVPFCLLLSLDLLFGFKICVLLILHFLIMTASIFLLVTT